MLHKSFGRTPKHLETHFYVPPMFPIWTNKTKTICEALEVEEDRKYLFLNFNEPTL